MQDLECYFCMVKLNLTLALPVIYQTYLKKTANPVPPPPPFLSLFPSSLLGPCWNVSDCRPVCVVHIKDCPFRAQSERTQPSGMLGLIKVS